ncbi:DUF4440 domain-containing protein [Streptomyces sp. NPDC018693]|uniref:nuclear transport factor 2 family protein n=1 Tax=unclassified Streptomyces TaxID=2593676 RepID=UPI0037A61037
MTERTLAVAAAVESELRLLDPAVRRSRDLTEQLLHPDFLEFGASGRRWDRASIVASMADAAADDERPITARRMTGVELAPGLVHLTFDTEYNGRHAHRSSLWRRTEEDGTWRLYFHQATPFSPAEA